jgi:ornithine carbamoyltransferase
MNKKIISINELSAEEVRKVVTAAADIKKRPDRYKNSLKKQTLFLLFQKTSTRTRLAFELGMKKLGGNTIVLEWAKSNFAISPLRYETRYVSSMVDCILARVLKNEDIQELARFSSVPVINGCCDMYHPSQILADLLTIYEVKGDFETTLTYVGIQNNVANSLFYACVKVGMSLIFVTPFRDRLPENFLELSQKTPGFDETLDLEEALSRSEFVYTDTWVNMEQFKDRVPDAGKRSRIEKMKDYQVNRKLIEQRNIYVMHDMPVHPGMEIDDYAINCEKSLIFQQAENRMYSAQALLLLLLDAL